MIHKPKPQCANGRLWHAFEDVSRVPLKKTGLIPVNGRLPTVFAVKQKCKHCPLTREYEGISS